MQAVLDPESVRELVHAFAKRAGDQGIRGGIRIVGGAAIALMNQSRHSTADVDALLLPPEDLLAIAAEMAQEFHLSAHWLNDSAKAYVPLVGLEDWIEIFREDEFTVSIGSPEMLLAMKLLANRGRRDTPDIEFLLEACGITSLADAQMIYERYHAQDVIPDAAAARILDWIDRDDPTSH